MNRIPCPSESWDAYSEGQEFPDDLCFNCLCELPEEDPDPANGGDSPWQEGFCSEECRNRVPVPRDEEQEKSLHALDHGTWCVGYSDEWSEDPLLCDCDYSWKEAWWPKLKRWIRRQALRLVRRFSPALRDLRWAGMCCPKCGNRNHRGSWSVYFDFEVWKHPSRGVLVAYEAILDSDAGCEGIELTTVPADKAPTNLPDYWASIGMDHGTFWTEAEVKESWEMNDRWNAALGKAISEAASIPSDSEVNN